MRSFSEVYPHLVKEWSPENALGPDQVSYGSNKAIIWNGPCGHTWTATPKNRGHNHGCPICSGNKIVAGLNDFAFLFPDIAKEWSDRNFPDKPMGFGPKSNRNVWWKCSSCGREWQARIADRTDGHGCPHCLRDSVQDKKQARIKDYKLQVQENQLLRHIGHLIKQEDFQFEVLTYYADKSGETVLYDYDYGIGIPVQFYFPEKCAAIELTSYIHEGWLEWRCENAKNWLCLKTDTKLVRIIPKKMKSYENCKCVRIRAKTIDALNYAIKQAFKKIKVQLDIDIVRDYDEIRRQKHEEN